MILKIITLSERTQACLWFYLYKTVQDTIQSQKADSGYQAAQKTFVGRITIRKETTFEYDKYVHYLDYGDGFSGLYMCQNLLHCPL